MKMAVTIMAYRAGILAWYDCLISSGKVEDVNNKCKCFCEHQAGQRFVQRSFVLKSANQTHRDKKTWYKQHCV